MPIRISSNEPVNRNLIDLSMPQIAKRALAVQNGDVLFSALQPKNFITQIFEQLKSCWNWIFSRFSSSSTSTVSTPDTSFSVEEKLNFGTAFIQDCLADPAVQPHLDSSCRVAIVGKLNQQIVSQHLTVMVRPALAISRQLAIDLLRTNLGIYAQDHPVRSSDEFKMEAYFLKLNEAGGCDVELIYQAQRSGYGHDHRPGLSRVNATQYLSSKYGNGGPQRDRFLQFLCFNL